MNYWDIHEDTEEHARSQTLIEQKIDAAYDEKHKRQLKISATSCEGEYLILLSIKMRESDAGTVSVEECMVSNEFICFIKIHCPYVYGTTLDAFIDKSGNFDCSSTYIEYQAKRICLNIFFALNNLQAKNLLELYLKRRYDVNYTVKLEYRETGEKSTKIPSENDCGYETKKNIVWKESINNFFPMPSNNIAKETIKKVYKSSLMQFSSNDCYWATDLLLRGYYLYATGCIKNTISYCVDGKLFVEADVYQWLTEQGAHKTDWQKIRIDVLKDCLFGLSDNVDSIDFITWVKGATEVAIYFSIINDKNLTKSFANAKLERIKYEKRKIEKSLQEQKQRNKLEQERKEKKLEGDFLLNKVKQKIEQCFSNQEIVYVKQRTYGAGIIKSIEKNYVMITFKSGCIRSFLYPQCFSLSVELITKAEYEQE